MNEEPKSPAFSFTETVVRQAMQDEHEAIELEARALRAYQEAVKRVNAAKLEVRKAFDQLKEEKQ